MLQREIRQNLKKIRQLNQALVGTKQGPRPTT